MARKKELPKGYTCSCGEWIPFHPYVAAHWNTWLVATCPNCGRKANVFAGDAQLIGKPRKPRKVVNRAQE